ncbi:MAG: CoA ester lyase [Ottowia sp.]|uniref:HpcH/HpaI aldolase/citrate lyase family protein n=1 Tax=Ottowia sp. TaxID=1898956 RepID=UPI003C7493F0
MKQIRSFLFVPGNKLSWIEKCHQSGADAVILDLEDSVPPDGKSQAREIVASQIAALAEAGQRVYVRINKGAFLYSMKDLEAVMQPGLEGIVLPKPNGPEDVDTANTMMSEMESNSGLPIGSTGLIPTLETANALMRAHEIATRQRVTAIICASARNGDVARSVGYQWTRQGLESLHFKSSAVIAARAAGKNAIAGLWQEVKDLEGLAESLGMHRQLGFMGEILIHPSHVATANAAYSPSEEDVRYYSGMIAAFELATSQGRAATIYEGEHIDHAHVATARSILGQIQAGAPR